MLFKLRYSAETLLYMSSICLKILEDFKFVLVTVYTDKLEVWFWTG